MNRVVRVRALVAAPLLACVCFTISAAGAGAAAPTGAKVVAPKPLIPRGATQLGPVSSSTTVSGAVVLQPRDESALTRFISQVTDKHSPLFHHYLAPGAFAARFGPTPEAVAAVRAQLQASGLTVTGVARDGLLVDFKAPAQRVESNFQTGLARYKLANGSIGQARTAPLKVPATIAKYVTSVVGLDTTVKLQPSGIFRAPRSARATHPAALAPTFTHPAGSPTACSDATATAQEFGGLTDDQIANAYGVFGLYGAGDTGSGQHIAIFELEPFSTTDLQTFDNCYFGATQATAMLSRVKTIDVDGGPKTGPGSGESILDIQDVSAFAPGASIDVYQAPNTSFASFDEYAKIVNNDTDQIVSTSWGICEQAVQEGSPGVQQAENLIFEQAAAQGQTIFSAAGDVGSDDCNAFRGSAPSSPILSVDDPSGQPYVVSTGGTTIDDATQPPSEHVWNDGALWGAAGGGISQSWGMPSWQLGSKVPGLNNSSAIGAATTFEAKDLGDPGYAFCTSENPAAPGTCREVPDVSARRGRVHERNHHLHRRLRRLEHDRRHVVGGADVGGHARGRQRVADLPGQQRHEERRRLRQPAALLGGVEPDGLRGLVQRREDGEQRPVRGLEPLPRHGRIRHGLGPRLTAADAARRRIGPRVLSLQPGSGEHPADRDESRACVRVHVGFRPERDDHGHELRAERHPGRLGRPGRQLLRRGVRLQRHQPDLAHRDLPGRCGRDPAERPD